MPMPCGGLFFTRINETRFLVVHVLFLSNELILCEANLSSESYMSASFQALDREHVSGDEVLNAISTIGLDRYSEDGTRRVAYDFV